MYISGQKFLLFFQFPVVILIDMVYHISMWFCFFSSIKFYHKKDYKTILFDRLVVVFLFGLFFYSPSFIFNCLYAFFFAVALWIALMISTIGIIKNARPREIEYSRSESSVNSNIFARNGTSTTAVVRRNEPIIAP